MLAALASFMVGIKRCALLKTINDNERSEPMTRPKGAIDSAQRALNDSRILHRFAGYTLLVGFLTLSACSAITSEEPPISDSTMVEVLIELHLTNARLELQHDFIPAALDSILFKHGLDRQRYRAIVDYYADHPEEYSALYTIVLDRLSDERLKQGKYLPLDDTPPPGVADEAQE